MSAKTREILQSARKPKEKTAALAQALAQKKIPAQEFIAFFKTALDKDQGACADAMKHVSAEKPEILAPFIQDLVPFITSKTARVKWGVPEAIGNLAEQYPKQVEKAITNLLVNTKDPSTVVRWCAAFALIAIAQHNPKARKELGAKMKGIMGKEKNNGVKKVYEKELNEQRRR